MCRIIDIKFHTLGVDASPTKRIISSDTQIVKVWDATSGEGYTSMQPEDGQINDVMVWPNSGA